ncbi:hypothetical protein KXR87_22220 [Yokenella regensburgei]|uniref:hypothetical protein n=1 Tax=Yokenella regensburgei TaxID=158877 RepID=UPI003F138EA2
MKERGMIFNAEMVRAILDGRKTQTRRIIQSAAKNMQARGHEVISHRAPGDKWYGNHVYSMRDRSGVWQDFTNEEFLAKCTFGQPGDHIWVRETFGDCGDRLVYRADIDDGAKCKVKRWTPSIHMPRCASRITLEITDVRVERLNDISQKDAIAEGAPPSHPSIDSVSQQFGYPDFSRSWFGQTWQYIYGEESWQANPWVWVIEFKHIEGDDRAAD